MNHSTKIWLPFLGVMLALLMILVAREGWSTQQARVRHSVRSRVLARVVPQAKASFDNGLTFSDAGPGAPPQTVSPDDARALRCTVDGARHSVVQLRYPESVTLRLSGSTSTPDTLVRVDDIQASFSSGGVLLPPEGSELRWGGTRGRLRFTQWEGSYVGKLPVTVVYP